MVHHPLWCRCLREALQKQKKKKKKKGKKRKGKKNKGCLVPRWFVYYDTLAWIVNGDVAEGITLKNRPLRSSFGARNRLTLARREKLSVM